MAAFALPLIRQIKKSKTERSAQKPFVPIPDTEEPEVLKVTRKYQPLHSQSTSQKVEQNSFSENRNDSGQRPGIYHSFG